MNKNYLAYLLLILTTIFWSGNFIVGKAASTYQIPPFTLNFYRWLFAGLILLPFTFKEILNKKHHIINNLGLYVVLGITSITIFNSTVYYSLYHTQVINSILLISTIPVWIIFFSFLLKIEKTNIYQIFGVIFSLIGVIAIITKSDIKIFLNLQFNKGDISMVIAMLSWAIYSSLLKKKKYELSQLSLLQIIMETPFILTLIYVVIFPGLLAFIFWIKGISIIGANRAGVFLHLMPIFGSTLAIIIFNEKFMYYHLFGAIFIILGLVLSNKKIYK